MVTPSFNHVQYVEDAILSVANQRYPEVEHIVVDGGSTDGTLEVLRRHLHLSWTSEDDRGQADAVNRGIARASGEILGWLNADDYYVPGALATIAERFATDVETDVLYGDCYYLYEDVEPPEVRLVRARPFDLDYLLNVGCYIHQPATFLRRSALDVGPLDEALRYVLDYDLWLRLARGGKRFSYLPTPLAAFRITGGSKSGAELEHFWPEARRVSLRHGGRRLSPMYRHHLRARIGARFPRVYGLLKRVVGRREGGD